MALVDTLRPRPTVATPDQRKEWENARLLDLATGITYHPRPINTPPPLVAKDVQLAEHPYARPR